MFKIIGSSIMNGKLLMCCQVDDGEMEIFDDTELVFLASYGTAFHSSDGSKIEFSSGRFIGDIPDLTAASNSTEEDEYESGYDEDSSDFDDEYGIIDREEEDEPEEELDDYDFASPDEFDLDTDEYEEVVGADDYSDMTDDDAEAQLYIPSSDDDQLKVDYYWDWRSKGAKITVSDDEIEEDEAEKTVAGESTESKLYNYVTDTQRALLQEYYLYISKRIFNLERGVNNLTVKRKTDLDGVRNTGGTWVYAGFLDMGYAGTSVCPYCGSILSRTSLSTCHQAPIVNVRERKKDKKAKDKIRYVARTHNGQCSFPGCTSRCSVVTSTVGVRALDRSRQQGVICQGCGKTIPQSSHYCTFNDPVRLMHIAWDVSVSDMETNFYGQLVDDGIEKLLDSNNCIKFGLGCIAEFFDISKNSEAFLALKNVQTVCLKDMSQLEEEYAKGDANREYIASSFGLLDSMIDRYMVIAAREALIKGDDKLPTKLLVLYKKMRAEQMIIPKSFIQFLRDLLLDWDVHKFVDGNSKGAVGRIGSIYGSMISATQRKRVDERAELILNGIVKPRKDNYYKWILGKEYVSCSYKLSSLGKTLLNYVTAIFVYKICGYYAYNALTQTDEGGRSNDEYGSHAQQLNYFYRSLEKALPKDVVYTYDYLKKVMDLGFKAFTLDSTVQGLLADKDACYNIQVSSTSLYDALYDTQDLYRLRTFSTIEDASAALDKAISDCEGYKELLKAYYEKSEEPDKQDMTIQELMDYLNNADLTGNTDIGVAILATVKSSGKTPTTRQFYHLRRLYESISGKTYTGEVPSEESGTIDSSFNEAYTYAKSHSGLVEDYVLSICSTVAKTGRASKKQLVYVNKLIDAYNKQKGGN